MIFYTMKFTTAVTLHGKSIADDALPGGIEYLSHVDLTRKEEEHVAIADELECFMVSHPGV